jgi:hypothetical protein
MRITSVLLAVVVLILVISLLCMWFYPSMQDFMAGNTMWNGIRDFCSEFEADNIDSLDTLPAIPDQTTLISIPYLEYKKKELSKIKQFIIEGGTLLLMDDYGYGNEILEYLNLDIRFSGNPLLDPLFCYKNQWMPRITDMNSDIKDSGINVILLNHATILTDVQESHVLAWSSEASFLDIDEDESLGQGEDKGPFPIAAKLQFGKGTIIVISDPSIIISSMVDRDDNYLFIEYLTNHYGEEHGIIVDRSHLSKTPLDTSKTRLLDVREALSSLYSLIGITAIIFAVVSRYTLQKGESSG